MKVPFRVRAVNTAADSENKIHDDAVAAGYGFRGGLVPGVTVYGYLATAAIQHFGSQWLERGAMDVRFREPVYDGEQVEIIITPDGACVRVDAANRAAANAWLCEESIIPEPAPNPGAACAPRIPSRETLAPGTVLTPLRERLDLAASKMSAPLNPSINGLAHPAVLLALANRIFVENYTLGPWIHVASEVRNFAPARDGEEIEVRGRITNRYEKKGHEFVELDIAIEGRNPILQVRHTAIWRPRKSQ